MRYNPFGPAVIFWRYTLIKRRHLSNSHNRFNSSIRTCSKFFDSVHSDQMTSAHTKGVLVVFAQPSRTTSLGFLSSRRPRKTGARNFLSRVHSANLISQTNTGFSQCILRTMEGVIPCTHSPFCFDGKSTNGQSLRSWARNFLCNIDNDFTVKPVPTLPAKTSFLLS